MRARRTAMVLMLVIVLTSVLSASADGAARRSCATLKGKRLQGKGSVRVVVQEKEVESVPEQVAYVCASPKGHAWTVNAESGLEEEARVTLEAAAGNWVAFTIVSAVGIGYEELGKAIDAKTGKSVRYWSFGGGPGPEEASELLEAVQINARGQLACVVGVTPTPKEGLVSRKVFGVEPTGKRQMLDSGPSAQISPSSLKLTGGTVHWTDAGAARSASL